MVAIRCQNARHLTSAWSLHKDDALQELLARLTAMGIKPMGAIEHAPSLVEKQTWKSTPPEVGPNGQAVTEEQTAP